MQIRNKPLIKLLIQSPTTAFCYYKISPKISRESRNDYEENAWKSLKLMIKVYKIDDGVPREIKKINIADNTDNCYINLFEDDIDIYVKVGRMEASGEFMELAESNIISLPRNKVSNNKSLYYVDISKNNAEEFTTSPNILDEEKKLDSIFTKDIQENNFFDEYYRNVSKIYENSSSKDKSY